MSDEIIWEEPPEEAAAPARATPYTKLAAGLKQNPRKWARLPGEGRSVAGAKQTALNIRRGKIRGFEEGAFETRIADSRIWVRFIGGEESTAGEQPQESAPRAPSAPRGGMAEQLSRRIRAWGQANGFELSEHGRLPRNVIEAYQAAHPHQTDDDADELLDEADRAGG